MEMRESEWFGYRRADFTFEDRDALIVFPNSDKNGHWMMKMEYFGAFPAVELELLSRGWHLLYLKNVNRWGTDTDNDAKDRFADFVSRQFGLDSAFTCVGMSCGGLCSVNFASRYPERVNFLYLDAPVMNLYSCPMGFGKGDVLQNGWNELQDAYGFDLPALLTYREHPMDRLSVLSEHRIPAALIYGDSDTTVPWEENGRVMEEHYRARNLPFYIEGKPGCGHHPHGPTDVKALCDYIENSIIRDAE